jgi:hypothetical protein
MAETTAEALARIKSQYAAPVAAAPVQDNLEQTQPSAISETLSSIKSRIGDTALPPLQGVTPIVQDAVEAPTQDFSQSNISENDLAQDEYFYPIVDYMTDRFGTHIKDQPREEVVAQFVNNMRGFAGGNSVRSLNEITYLNEVSGDETKLAKAGKAYELFDSMQGLTGDTTWGEKASILGDYARSAVLDPINLLGLGIGKVATSGGFKATSQAALLVAKQTFKKEMAKGATQAAAQKTAEGVFKATAAQAATDAAAKMAQRQAIEKAATTTLQRMTTSTAIKEGAIVGGFEATVAAATDYIYQDAMLRTGVQDEYSLGQTALSGTLGLVLGGLSGRASNVGTGASGLLGPTALKSDPTGNKALGKLFSAAGEATGEATDAVTPSPTVGNWLADVANGKELRDQDNQFFVTMIEGDKEKNLKGLADILLEEGYVWKPRSEDDKVSNWVGDIIKTADPQDAQKFLDDFTKATGISMDDGKALTIEAFADTFKKKMSDSGKLLKSMSYVAGKLSRKAEDLTGDDYLGYIIGGVIPESARFVSPLGKKIGEVTGDLINRDLPDFQNNIIRLLVSNLSTTALNVAGYASATAMSSGSDIVRAALLGGKAGLYMVYKPKEAAEAGISALSIIQNQMQKAKNVLDINTTYDTFKQYAEVRPETMRKLANIDGVNSSKIDMGRPLLSMKVDAGVDFIQRANLVNAQDGYTKSIEFVTQMDKFMRRSPEQGGLGVSWNEFFAKPDHHKMMITKEFANIEAMAVDETLKATFSKSYKSSSSLGQVAGLIEDARKIPGIGLLIPFGKFFNNTVAMAYDMTAVGPFIAAQAGGQQNKLTSEILAKGIVSWSLIGALALQEKEYIDKGLGWSEQIDPMTGEVTDERYAFPYGALKAIARVAAHKMKGEEVPLALSAQITDQFVGQLTRQLGDAGTGFNNIATSLLSDEGVQLGQVLQDTLGTVASQAISGITRPLEPINTAIGLTRDEAFYIPDRKQGTKWFNNAIRYFDQMVALATGEDTGPVKYDPAEGQQRVTASRLVSTTRATKLTSTKQVFSMIGKPGYTAGANSMSEAADNRFNQLFNQIVEVGASRLYDNKDFKEGNLEKRQFMVEKLVKSAKSDVKAYMGRLAANSEDGALLKMMEVSSYKKDAITRARKDLGFEKDVDSLTERELDVLATALKFREDYVMQKGN